MPELSPSLLATDPKTVQEEVSRAEKLVESLHVDVMDNKFVPNDTLGRFPPSFVKSLRTKLPQDVHLMVENPRAYFADYAKAGARSITFHFEAERECEKAIAEIRALRKMAGISIKPKTPVSAIEHLLPIADLVLVMAVEPGFGGQKFMPEALDKIRELRRKDAGYVVVDGGVNFETAPLCLRAGANVLVAGTAFFKAPDLEEAAKKLRGF